MNKVEVLQKLKETLEDMELPKAWAARKVEVTPEYFNRVMSGVNVPGEDLAEKCNRLLLKLESSGLKQKL